MNQSQQEQQVQCFWKATEIYEGIKKTNEHAQMRISLVSIKISATPHTNHGDFDVEISFSPFVSDRRPSSLFSKDFAFNFRFSIKMK